MPITLQTYAIGIIILFSPSWILLLSIFTYVSLGILGLPIFSDNSKGVRVLFGPTGGYIIGFLVVAVCFYFLKKLSLFSTENLWITFSWIIIAHLIIITCGFCRLTFLIGYRKAFYNGILILIIPAIIKSLMIILTFIIFKHIQIF
ncbi:biotin transporter BioY [Francisella sp. 19X1-34]|uniref:biotin transporter BioY n=1 Tax=Francisella sp. 19X1-34 TaxID=3087177 RepID=UPI002E37944D|nr:biotin transporter BioY [Francisella sp. 19X1-34]MED7787708.1 biotin transporter BioY [Francisella sp. 19X1-34]